jgi:hypothetical protein
VIKMDIILWRLLIWTLGLTTPLLAAVKPRSYLAGTVEYVERVGSLSRMVTQGLYLYFLMIAAIAFVLYWGKEIDMRAEQRRALAFFSLSIILAAMPTISSVITGGTLQWTIVGTIGIYSATNILPVPPLDWWIREVRRMLLFVFVYGSLAVAILFPEWAWNQAYASESSTALLPMRLFGTANHANALVPLAVFAWMLGRYPKCRLAGEVFHGGAILLVMVLAQSKTSWVAVSLLLIVYFSLKIRSLTAGKKYLTFFALGGALFLILLYLTEITHLIKRIEDILYDPQLLTLTGRIPLWLMAIDIWMDGPWLGQGLDAWSSEALLDNVGFFGWAAPNAHNQLLQILSQSGLLGLIVMMVWGLMFVNIVKNAPRQNRISHLWLCAFYFLPGVTEVVMQFSVGPGHTVLTWIMITLTMNMVRGSEWK